MKTNQSPLHRYRGLRLAAVALMSALALPAAADAKPKEKKKGKSHPSHSQTSARHSDHNDDHDHHHSRTAYFSHPHASFSLSFGNGYAGQGYYWGPPNAAYYYQRPEVRYYRSRDYVPRAYLRGYSGYGSPGYGYSGYGGASVQRALARQGYYYGPIDGDIGPGSRRAIARYQADRGLRVTGSITPGLLDSLGLR